MTATPTYRPHWLVAIAIALAGLTFAATAQAATMVSVARNWIYARNGPGTNHQALWQLGRGYPLRVVGRSHGWLKVRDFENDESWVLGKLTNRTPHMVVKVDNAHLRSGPGTKYRIVEQAVYGDTLRTLQVDAKWVKVRTPSGKTAWISRKLVWGW